MQSMASGSQPVLDNLWVRLLESLSHQLAPTDLDSWLRPCRLIAVEGDHLRIGAPNRFARDWLLENHVPALQSVAEQCVGGHPRVSIVVDEAAATAPDEPAPTTPALGESDCSSEELAALVEHVLFDDLVGPQQQYCRSERRTALKEAWP